jgi:hypothetical protein
MATVDLTAELRAQYQELFDSCEARPEHAHSAQTLVTRIAANQSRYAAVGTPLAIPWYVIGVIHCMEGSLNFGTYLHNGDPLNARTVQVPAGRPPTVSRPSRGKKARSTRSSSTIWPIGMTGASLEFCIGSKRTTALATAPGIRKFSHPTCGVFQTITRAVNTWPTAASLRPPFRTNAGPPYFCAIWPKMARSASIPPECQLRRSQTIRWNGSSQWSISRSR